MTTKCLDDNSDYGLVHSLIKMRQLSSEKLDVLVVVQW